ncbi:MAG: phosphatidylserine/phosphatidylglycerophosphate/cardiolipin synthase family protein [Planctomycetes bacterium]|nr:phosphatidylserine/phosphatidylglycerophosphate/cardiolipin synthase family protein [Planctomycetota bacterium]
MIEYAYLWWEIFGHIQSILKETLQATHQLIDDNRCSLEKSLQTTNQLIRSATTCGLTNIYCSRKEVKGDIYDAIESAEKRVWLLGITFSENVHLDELLSTLSRKSERGLDVKILLLDALRSSAVFRTLLESTDYEAAKIFNTNRAKTQTTDDPYFHQRLYSDFTHVCDRLKSYPNIGIAVRFYTHTPTCWMMIIDKTAHFQPYTFGLIASKHPSNLCANANMPVFKFQIQPNGKPFEILEDHFQKLWLTSDVDLFHIEARIADRNRVIKDIFDSHSSWFNHAFEVLHAPNGNMPSTSERRKFPRQTWEWIQPLLNVCLQDRKAIIKATIFNFSREGLSLKLEATTLPMLEGQVVTLQGESPKEPIAANFVVDHFLKIKRFKVKRVTNGLQPIIGLQVILESEISNEPNQIGSVSTSSPSLT